MRLGYSGIPTEVDVSESVAPSATVTVVDHPDLQDVAGLSLPCREGLVLYYESLGVSARHPLHVHRFPALRANSPQE